MHTEYIVFTHIMCHLSIQFVLVVCATTRSTNFSEKVLRNPKWISRFLHYIIEYSKIKSKTFSPFFFPSHSHFNFYLIAGSVKSFGSVVYCLREFDFISHFSCWLWHFRKPIVGIDQKSKHKTKAKPFKWSLSFSTSVICLLDRNGDEWMHWIGIFQHRTNDSPLSSRSEPVARKLSVWYFIWFHFFLLFHNINSKCPADDEEAYWKLKLNRTFFPVCHLVVMRSPHFT